MATPEEYSEARRKNGAKSRGPKTAEGRQATDLSKVRHGVRCEKPVIPGMETAREWEAHYCAFAENLAPSGPVEGALVYRIALNFWRLGRLTKAETAAVSVSLAIEADHSLLSDNGSGSVERAREALELFNWIESRDDESIDSLDAQTLLNGWPYEYDGDDELYERSSWTCGQLRRVFSQYAERDDKTPEAVLVELRDNLASAIKSNTSRLKREVALWPPVAHLFGCFRDGYSVRGLTGTNSPSCRLI